MRSDSYLRDEDFDEEHLRKRLFKTEFACDKCGDQLLLDDEIVFVQIVQAQHVDGVGVEYYEVVDDDTGDYVFSPSRAHIECWEAAHEDMKEVLSDVPPHYDERRNTFLRCTLCDSNIRQWERFGLVEYGEMKNSPRFPQGRVTTVFVAWDEVTQSKICTSCLTECAFWPHDIPEHDECTDCTHARCWRDATCDCRCHTIERE